MSKIITLSAFFSSVEEAERAAFRIRSYCPVNAIRLSHFMGEPPKTAGMGALLFDYGYAQTAPIGDIVNDPSYPPFWFSQSSESESESRRRKDVYSDGCRLSVLVTKEWEPSVRRIIVNCGGRRAGG